MKRLFPALLAVSIAVLTAASCSSRVETVVLRGEGGDLPLRERPGVSAEKEGRLVLRGESLSTPRYLLPEEAAGAALAFEYTSPGIELFLDTGDDPRAGEAFRSFRLPTTPEGWRTEVVLAPEPGLLPAWFRFRSGELPAASRFLLHGVSAAPASREPLLRVLFGDGSFPEAILPVAGSGGIDILSGFAEPGISGVEFSIRREPEPLYRTVVDISYDYVSLPDSPVGSARLSLLYGAGGEGDRYGITLRPGSHRLSFLPSGDFRGDVRIEIEGEGLSNTAVELRREAKWMDGSWTPLPADMGEMLHRPASSWRRSDFELYSWNLYPSLLVFDYRDYALQSAMLKRLAFFVEKKGTAGSVLSNSMIENRHGWNAHDYRSGDLARFFTEAAARDMVLNPEEYLLREVLLENGLIEETGEGSWRGVDGGILSLSRETSDRLRYLFMVHEGYHGLFFSSAPFRDRVFALWDSLEEEERGFWRHFLDWKRYNVEDRYLLVNEFMAYLMQQSTDRVEPYFFDYVLPSMMEAMPEARPELESFLLAYPDHFLRCAELIEEAAFEVSGVLAGDLFDSKRIE